MTAVPVALFVLGGTAQAQSADAIIAALKPGGNLASGATRGIKLGGSSAAPQPAPVAHPASTSAPVAARPPVVHSATRAPVETQATAAGPSVNLTVNFPTGSADLTPAARASLDALGKALASSDLATFRFRIEGHTD